MQTDDNPSTDLDQAAPVQSEYLDDTPSEAEDVNPAVEVEDLSDEAEAKADAEPTQDDPAKQDDDNPGKEEDDEPEQPRRGRAAERIHQLVTKGKQDKAEANEEIRYWQNQAATLAQNSQAAEDLDPLDFDSEADYTRAIVNEAINQSRQSNAEDQIRIAAEKAHKASLGLFRDRVDDARGRIDDYDEVTRASRAPTSPEIEDAIINSDIGPEMHYHLCKNENLAAEIASLPPAQAYMRLGQIEGRLSAGKPKKISSAPKPVPTVTGKSAVAQKRPEDMSFAEYKKHREQQMWGTQ